MSDLERLLHDTAPRPSRGPDQSDLRDRIRARRRRRHLGTGLLSVVLLAVAALGVNELLDRPPAVPDIAERPDGSEPAPEPTTDVGPGTATPTDPAGDAGPSQSAADAARDGVVSAVAALSFKERVDPTHTIATDEGIWVGSNVPDRRCPDGEPTLGDTDGRYGRDFVDCHEYAELLLLDPHTFEIAKAWPLPGFPWLQLRATPTAVWAFYPGDGGLPDSLVVHVDRTTMSFRGRVAPAEPDTVYALAEDNTSNGPILPPDTVVRPFDQDSAPATRGDVAWFGNIGFDEALDVVAFVDDGWVVSDGVEAFLLRGQSVTPIDSRTLEPLAGPLDQLPASASNLPAASIQPLAIVLDDGALVTHGNGTWEVVTTGVLQHATSSDGVVHVVHDDGMVRSFRLGPPVVATGTSGPVPTPVSRDGVNRSAGFEDVSLAVGTGRIAWWNGNVLTQVAHDQIVTREDMELLTALDVFARDPSVDTLARLPLADEVALGLGNTTYVRTTAEELVSPQGWVIDGVPYAEFDGPFSALERVASRDTRDASVGPHAHCAGPPLAAPTGLADARQVTLTNTDAESCIDWWSVDLFVVDGEIAAVMLQLFGP